ncbi:transposase [Streptomyces sp. NPDC056543]|uniref:transposase n=1 Tax=unclassified Streptomyces TaxID=2593676 RepID=UPI0036A323E6
MLDGRRKSIQPMAERLPDGNMQALQQFVNQSPWDPLPVRRRIAERLREAVNPEVWVVDDVSFPKCGKTSVGVGHGSTAERWANGRTARSRSVSMPPPTLPRAR